VSLKLVMSLEVFPVKATKKEGKFDLYNEIKKLTQLIAEPRQDKEFKSKNFVYEGTKKNIPQTVIDKLR